MGQDSNITRRRMLAGAGGMALALPFARLSFAADAPASPETKIETPDNLFCAYVDRATGSVVSVKSFAEVNPEIVNGPFALNPYIAPSKNVSFGNRAPTVFKLDVKRYGIVDFAKRNDEVGSFSSLYDAYTPGEFTHHFLLTLADRELGREGLGAWSLNKASAAQKARALELIERVHTGYNGDLIKGDADKMAEATRFYTGRELLRPMLFLGTPPGVGAMVMLPQTGLRVAEAGRTQIALSDAGAVAGAVSVGTGSSMASAVSTASQGATTGGVSAVATAVGASAGVGGGGGGSTSTGSSSGTSSTSSSSSSSGSSGGGAGGGAGGGGGCFIAGTLVLMADGNIKPIADVKVGEKLLGRDGAINEVLRLMQPKLGERLLYAINDENHFVTSEHPFLAKDGTWKAIDPDATAKENVRLHVTKLEIGDILRTADGDVVVESIRQMAGSFDTPLYNVHLSGSQTYFANGFAVHNK